jgi:hypothetical protein
MLRALYLRTTLQRTAAHENFDALLQADKEPSAIVHLKYSVSQLFGRGKQVCGLQRRGTIAPRHEYCIAACEGIHKQISARFPGRAEKRIEREVQRELNVQLHKEQRKLS